MPQNATAALLVHEVRLYFEGRMQCFKTPVDLCEITPFRRLILKALRETPFGETTTYGDLATRAGRPGAARAVGGAVAANPVPLLIPCHRVLASGGGLGGFSAHGGRSLKRRLLAHEGITR